MAESIEASLLELWDRNICPNCGKTIPQGTREGVDARAKAASVASTAIPAFINSN
jgi:hypothetical protein